MSRLRQRLLGFGACDLPDETELATPCSLQLVRLPYATNACDLHRELRGAMEENDSNMVQRLLERLADPNHTCEPYHRHTSLHGAVVLGQLECLNMLIEAEADPNIAGPGRRAIMPKYPTKGQSSDTSLQSGTPLHWATGKNLQILGALLEARADANFRNECDSTPLHSAVLDPHGSIGMVEALLRARGDTSLTTCRGKTVLRLAIDSGNTHLLPPLFAANTGALREQLAKDAECLTRGCQAPPLHAVSRRCSLEALELLLQARCDINEREFETGDTPLHFVCDKATALWWIRNATESRPTLETDLLAVVKLLARARANLTARNKKGLTAMQVATRQGHTTIVDFLKMQTPRTRTASLAASSDAAGWSGRKRPVLLISRSDKRPANSDRHG